MNPPNKQPPKPPAIKARALGLSTPALSLITAPPEYSGTLAATLTHYQRRRAEGELTNLIVRAGRLRAILLHQEGERMRIFGGVPC